MFKGHALRKILFTLISLLLIAAVGAYFYFKGKEYTVHIPEATLQQKAAEKMPIAKRYLILFEVTLANPRINLENGSNRINSGLDVNLNITINEQPKPLSGSIDISSGLKYDNTEGRFFLTDPIIEELNIHGIPEIHVERVKSLITKALVEYYSRNPVYSLSALSAKQAAANLILKNIVVTNKELVVTLGI
jgi:hypothetical protein